MKTLTVKLPKQRQCVRCSAIFGWHYTCPECASITTRDAKYATGKVS